MIWACFAATGTGRLAVTESTMNCSVHQSVLKSAVRPPVQQRKLGCDVVVQQDNDPK